VRGAPGDRRPYRDPALPVTVVDEAHVAAVSDDHVVEDSDADDFADFSETPGDFQVLPGRRRRRARGTWVHKAPIPVE
jgi:hypothetical protein